MSTTWSVYLSNYVTNQSFATAGVFYFVPAASGNLLDGNVAQGFQGTIQGQVTINGVVRPFKIHVEEGYSTSGPGVVSSGTSILAVMRQQQRLNFLGFPGRNGQALSVDGQIGSATTDGNTRYAIRLFNASVRGTPQHGLRASSIEGLVSRLTRYSLTPQWPRVGNAAVHPGYQLRATHEC